MFKSYKYRIYPTINQKEKIDRTIGVCRLIYNLGLQCKIWAHQGGVRLSDFDLGRQLTDLKKEYTWMSEVDSQSLYGSLKNLDSAFRGLFNGRGFPKFKSKKSSGSFQCPKNTRKIDFENGFLTIPKIANIPISISRRFDGKIKTISISRTATGKYFASILVDNSEILPTKPQIKAKTTIGIDVGIKSFAVTNDGRVFEKNRYLKNSMRRLKCLQHRASKKKKGSNNRKKANKKVALLYEKITNQRTDYIHKVTSQLICDNQVDTFVIEDLHVAGMLKNRKLSQAIQDVSFGEFFEQMKYKCDWYGKNLIVINRFAPSSKRCSNCGEINQQLTLSDREWVCGCGVTHDRDLNAAKNIKQLGLEKYSRSERPVEPAESRRLRRAKKQECVYSLHKSQDTNE